MTMSYRDAVTRRNQGAGQVNVLSENRKPVAIPKTLAKHKPLSHAIQGATLSAPASPSSARASVIHFGSFSDPDPACNCCEPASEVAKVLDQESVEAEFRRQSKTGGISRNEEERVKKFTRLPDDGEIKLECLGSEANFSIKSLKELKPMLTIRDELSKFLATKRGKDDTACMKDELKKHPAVESDMFFTINRKVLFPSMLKLMILQADNRNLKANFSDPEWRERRRFPKFENGTDEYSSWEENFDPEIVQRRLKIMEEVTKKVVPQREYFLICQCASKVNAIVHPPDDLQTVTEMAERKEFVVGGVDLGPAMLFMTSSGSQTLGRNKKI